MDIVTGDNADFLITLHKANAVFSIPTTAVIRAAIISRGNPTSAVGCVSTAVGADWTNSLIAIHFPSRVTMQAEEDPTASLEIEVNDAGDRKTWFVQGVNVIKGHI